MNKLNSKNAPLAIGPYSHAIISNGLVFCSGQIGIDPKTNELNGSDIISQTTQAIFNIKSVLHDAGSSIENVIKTTCYLTDLSNYHKFNEIYGNFFTNKPARATIEVSNLPKNALIEIELIAQASNDK